MGVPAPPGVLAKNPGFTAESEDTETLNSWFAVLSGYSVSTKQYLFSVIATRHRAAVTLVNPIGSDGAFLFTIQGETYRLVHTNSAHFTLEWYGFGPANNQPCSIAPT